MFFEELPSVLRIVEGLSTSRARGGKSARQVAGREACRQISAPHILMEKSRVKAISRTHGVHSFDR
jgi:hypothetical protein